MQRALVLLILSGCWETRSPAGTFLSEVHVQGDQLVSVACDVDFATTHTLNSNDSRLDTSACLTQRDTFPSDTPAALFAPTQCRDAIELWQNVATASAGKREQVWRTLSPACRGLIAGDQP